MIPVGLLGYAGLVVVLYGAGHRAGDGTVERAIRTLLVSLNAAANGALLWWLGVPILAVGVGLVNLVATVPRLAGQRGYVRLLAGTSVAMPLSWPATLAGAAIFSISLVAAAFGRPLRVGFDRETATLIVHGAALYLFPCGYNLGNFVFIHPEIRDASGRWPIDLVAHETGHTLNVAALGSVFHFVGAIHENWGPPPGGAYHQAYAERLAESRRRAPGHPRLAAWPTPKGRS